MSGCHCEFVSLVLILLAMSSSYSWSVWRNELLWGLIISFLICAGSIYVFRLSVCVSIIAFAMFLAGFVVVLACRYRRRDESVALTSFEYPDFYLCFALVYIAALVVYFFRAIVR